MIASLGRYNLASWLGLEAESLRRLLPASKKQEETRCLGCLLSRDRQSFSDAFFVDNLILFKALGIAKGNKGKGFGSWPLA